MTSPPALHRTLGLSDATAIGLGSMLGAGVFAVFAPAAGVAGGWLIVGLAIAGVIAWCNAIASAQLAAQYPSSGGTYVYGRERLGPWSGFFAGWSFVIGKTASCAAMALVVAAYTVPEAWQKPVAVIAVVAVTTVNCLGVSRTARATKIIVVCVLAVLALVVIAAAPVAVDAPAPIFGSSADPYAILQAAGLLFFAFAGYARIATMAEEVRDPARTIPRAVILALSIAFVVYAVIALTALLTLGPDRLAASTAPLAEVAGAGGWTWTEPVVRAGAALAALGALLALIAGIGRTSLAMAREGDLPRWFSVVSARFGVPHRAEIAVAAAICVLILVADLRNAIGFSSFGVLLYYFVANVAAFTQDREHRRVPKAVNIAGAIGCLVLVATLPVPSIIGGLIVIAAGLVYRLVRVSLARSR